MRKEFHLAYLLLSFLLLSACSDSVVVETSTGRVSGSISNGAISFLGIPYAKAERFMPPVVADSWDTVMICNQWGPRAMQPMATSIVDEKIMSEKNSLVLNVWTTNTKSSKPVMVWLHGGGFDSGTSEWNPGYNLAKRDVVVVSLNHRLNILGFLDLSALSERYKYSANVGMLDIVAALKWVRENISNFGGDPNNVTIFGESGGGGKVGTLLSMPSASGLFHKAIIMSGTILNVNDTVMSRKLGCAVVDELNIDRDNLEAIDSISYQQLYEAGQRALATSVGRRRPGTPMMWGFGPTPDGNVLLCQPFQPGFSDISDHIPLLIGTTYNELQPLRYATDISIEMAKNELYNTFGEDTDAYIEAFAKAYPDFSPADLLSIDWLFRPKTIITSDSISKSRASDIYLYLFSWRSPQSGGSVHGDELNFCFNTLERCGTTLPEPTLQDTILADRMSAVWASFAHTANPNIDGLPAWQPYTEENGELMEFNYNCRVRNNHDRELQEIINRHCFKLLSEFLNR